jgi:hypothetical protein
LLPEIAAVLRETVEQPLGGGAADVHERRVLRLPAHQLQGEKQLVVVAVDHIPGGSAEEADLDTRLIEKRRDVLVGFVSEDPDRASLGGLGGEELGDAGGGERLEECVAEQVDAVGRVAHQRLPVRRGEIARGGEGGDHVARLGRGRTGRRGSMSGQRSCSGTSSARATLPRWRA